MLLIVALLAGCQTSLLAGCRASSQCHEPLRAIDRPIQLERFMGDWYVIAHIPTFIEEDAYNGVESYRLAEDGTIPNTYTFNDGGLDGPLKTYHPRGFVHNRETSAEWRMRFVWPFKAAYLIVYLRPRLRLDHGAHQDPARNALPGAGRAPRRNRTRRRQATPRPASLTHPPASGAYCSDRRRY